MLILQVAHNLFPFSNKNLKFATSNYHFHLFLLLSNITFVLVLSLAFIIYYLNSCYYNIKHVCTIIILNLYVTKSFSLSDDFKIYVKRTFVILNPKCWTRMRCGGPKKVSMHQSPSCRRLAGPNGAGNYRYDVVNCSAATSYY